MPSGIKRVATEIFATEIIIGFALKSQFTPIFFSEILLNILLRIPIRLSGFAAFSPHLSQHKKIVVVCPRYADREYGFNLWLDRVFRLAKTLKVPCEFLSTTQTFPGILKSTHMQARSPYLKNMLNSPTGTSLWKSPLIFSQQTW